jgi:hypothetical protein
MIKIPGTLKMGLVAVVAAVSLCAAVPASAAGSFRGGGHHGGSYSRGGHYGGYYRGGGHRGGYYRGGGRHGDWDFDFVIGGPYWGWGAYPYYYPYYSPYYYSYPYYYPYGPAVTQPSLPEEYVERTGPDESASTAPSDIWYYCPRSKAYYPYVKECPGGWETVPASPEPESDEQAAAQSDLWYYCAGSKAYYPYVKECPGGWQTVPAGPPSGTGR